MHALCFTLKDLWVIRQLGLLIQPLGEQLSKVGHFALALNFRR
jgi:hypothetical protein